MLYFPKPFSLKGFHIFLTLLKMVGRSLPFWLWSLNRHLCILTNVPLLCSFIVTNFTVENWNEVDVDDCGNDLLRVADLAVKENHHIGAILLECTNMAPFSRDIQRATGLPVYDVISLLDFMWSSVNKRNYADGGWI